MNKKKIIITISSIIIVAIVLIASVSLYAFIYDIKINNELLQQSTSNLPVDKVNVQRTGIFISKETAKQLALNSVGSGEVLYINADIFDLTPKYEVQIMSNGYPYDVEVSALTGRITSLEIDY